MSAPSFHFNLTFKDIFMTLVKMFAVTVIIWVTVLGCFGALAYKSVQFYKASVVQSCVKDTFNACITKEDSLEEDCGLLADRQCQPKAD